MTVIKERETQEMKFLNVTIKNLLISQKPSISFALIKLSGKNKKCRNLTSNTYYYILGGDGSFIIDEKKYPVKKGDLVYVPKNSIYQDRGNLRMLSIAVPKFDAKKIRIVEEV